VRSNDDASLGVPGVTGAGEPGWTVRAQLVMALNVDERLRDTFGLDDVYETSPGRGRGMLTGWTGFMRIIR
jgi:hypothetical protein